MPLNSRSPRAIPALVLLLVSLPLSAGRSHTFVSSFNGDAVMEFDNSGQCLGPFTIGGPLDGPTGHAFGPDGFLYVSSYYTNSILRYNAVSGQFQGIVIQTEPHPQSIIFSRDDNSIFTGTSDPMILRIDIHTYQVIDTIGLGQLVSPEDLVLGSGPRLLVTDVATNSVKQFNVQTGEYLGTFTQGGNLVEPQGLTFGRDGNLYVASSLTNQILRYRGSDGMYMGVFATGAPEDTMAVPRFGFDGNLYVSCYGSDRIRRFDGATGAFLGLVAPPGSCGVSGPNYLSFHNRPAGVSDSDGAGRQALTIFPNPAGDESSILIDLSRENAVELGLYGADGRLVLPIVLGSLPAGSHRIRFSSAGLAGGVYFCKGSIGGVHESQRFVRIE